MVVDNLDARRERYEFELIRLGKEMRNLRRNAKIPRDLLQSWRDLKEELIAVTYDIDRLETENQYTQPDANGLIKVEGNKRTLEKLQARAERLPTLINELAGQINDASTDADGVRPIAEQKPANTNTDSDTDAERNTEHRT